MHHNAAAAAAAAAVRDQVRAQVSVRKVKGLMSQILKRLFQVCP